VAGPRASAGRAVGAAAARGDVAGGFCHDVVLSVRGRRVAAAMLAAGRMVAARMLAVLENGPALTLNDLIPVPFSVWHYRDRLGSWGGRHSWATASACDPGVAVWTADRQVIRTVKRQSGSRVRRWGV
jgi:hypothetical protein